AGTAYPSQTVSLLALGDAARLVDQLQQQGHDAIFEEALTMAAQLTGPAAERRRGRMSAAAPQIKVYDDLAGLARATGEFFVARSQQTQGAFRVALSGGHTPIELHELLAASSHRERVAWDRVQFYWGDDRCVPPDDEQSNYRMARETLLDPLGIPAEQIH